MLKKFFNQIGKVFLAPPLYILMGTVSASTLMYQGFKIIFGEGVAFIVLGIIIFCFTFALCRSVSSAQ